MTEKELILYQINKLKLLNLNEEWERIAYYIIFHELQRQLALIEWRDFQEQMQYL